MKIRPIGKKRRTLPLFCGNARRRRAKCRAHRRRFRMIETASVFQTGRRGLHSSRRSELPKRQPAKFFAGCRFAVREDWLCGGICRAGAGACGGRSWGWGAAGMRLAVRRSRRGVRICRAAVVADLSCGCGRVFPCFEGQLCTHPRNRRLAPRLSMKGSMRSARRGRRKRAEQGKGKKTAGADEEEKMICRKAGKTRGRLKPEKRGGKKRRKRAGRGRKGANVRGETKEGG